MVVNHIAANLVDKARKHNASLQLVHACVLCGQTTYTANNFCTPCIADLPIITTACPLCAVPTPFAAPCADCIQRRRHYINSCHALFSYDYPVNTLINKMKFNGSVMIAHSLGMLLAQHIKDYRLSLPNQIIPMPLHPGRLAGRGYNQSLEVARPLARALNIPLNIRACKRIRATLAQSELPAHKRRRNIRKAFKIVEQIDSQHIVIVDDVMTTGSTVNELARTLVAAGVARVDVWVCARAVIYN